MREMLKNPIFKVVAPMIVAAGVAAPFYIQHVQHNETSGVHRAQPSDDSFLDHNGDAHVERRVAPGHIEYDKVDSLGRARGAHGQLTTELRQQAKIRGRGNNPDDTNANPSGWGHNKKVAINYPGGGTYHGYFWNRSHLIADSLGGKAAADSWITGTRTQNVGRNNGKGGMAYSETIARKYLDDASHTSCPLYYAARPNYEGKELIPRSVTVDMKSCDGSINERVTVHNDAPGYLIDYNTGEFSKDKAKS